MHSLSQFPNQSQALLLTCGEEVDLLRRISGGEEAALRAVYDLYGGRMFGGALRALGNQEDSREVVQDWLVKVWDKAKDYDPLLSAPGTWLTMLCRGLVANKLRSRGRQLAAVPLEADDTLVCLAPGSLDTCAEGLERIFAEFSSEERRYLDASVFTAKTHEEIAKEFGEALGTVKGRIRRAMDKLKQLIEHEWDL